MTVIRHLTVPPSAGVLGPAPGTVESAEQYAAVGGYAGTTTPDALLDHLDASGLRGRGGAGFPASVKLGAVRDRGRAGGGTTPVVVANGEEGEPGSVKDRWLLRTRPHLVLDGLARAAAVTGAGRGYVYLSDPEAAARVRGALAERPPALPVTVVETGHAYVAGEESAVVRRIDGGPALPRAKPPRPFEQGVGGAPTLVSNVETLARIALTAARPDLRLDIARSTLVTLSGGPGAPLLTEVPYGTPLRDLADAVGVPDPAGALMGGLFGGLVDAGALGLPLEPDALAAAGTALGCGAVRFLAGGGCPVSAAADAAGYLAAESSRQCGVCVSGTAAIYGALAGLAAGTAAPDTAAHLERWSTGLRGRGACALLDAAASLAGSLLRAFPTAVASHLTTRCEPCTAATAQPTSHLTVPVPPVTDRRSAAGPSGRPPSAAAPADADQRALAIRANAGPSSPAPLAAPANTSPSSPAPLTTPANTGPFGPAPLTTPAKTGRPGPASEAGRPFGSPDPAVTEGRAPGREASPSAGGGSRNSPAGPGARGAAPPVAAKAVVAGRAGDG
ncbi:NADH-ubiquinone oxidoreductase-F iron-sulfur binding region domain-containing protein [Streptomyces sp. NPDC086023]|uniref:NADH-ubiquinone oxidoreductase-F iron-sulfur binding region domain-containing protein n=1 Tax=Streptomyces sp. NPDC086023 TaxID=3365746 RepID=UPI0037D703AE